MKELVKGKSSEWLKVFGILMEETRVFLLSQFPPTLIGENKHSDLGCFRVTLTKNGQRKQMF